MNERQRDERLRQLGNPPKRGVRVSLTTFLVALLVTALVAFEVGLNVAR